MEIGQNIRETKTAIKALFSKGNKGLTTKESERISEKPFPDPIDAPLPSNSTEGATSLDA